MGNRIYFDHAATTPLDKSVINAMSDFQSDFYGNPNSLHMEGQQARAKIDFARAEIAGSIFSKPQEIIFTSGATESNNHAILGIASAAIFESNMKPHIITTQVEHLSVYNVVKTMEERGIVEATYLKPDANGMIQAEDVVRAVQDNTVLVSIIFVSNEIGSVLPIREIGRHLAEINAKQQHKIYFHTDAVQAFKYYNCHVDKLGVDLMTISAHKLNGPKGIGALYIRTGTKLHNLMSGGSQEYGMRPGTQNSAAIIGFAQAVKMLGGFEDRQTAGEKIRQLTNHLETELKKLPDVEINGPSGDNRTPNILNFTVKGVDQEIAIAKLDMAGFAVSTGSACVSGSSEPSHVIKALGKKYPDPSAMIRVSLGSDNTKSQIDKFLDQIKILK